MGRTVYYNYKGEEIDPPSMPEAKQTNADRVRSMTDEELCDEYFRIYHNVLPRYTHSRLGLLDWLKQEAEE